MEEYGFAVIPVGFLVVAWWLTRLMSAAGRNDDRTHGSNSGGFGS